jgi:MFS family permease
MAEEAQAPGLSAAERHGGLAAAITMAAVFGIGAGFSTPLLSLLLEERGTVASLIGLNAAATFIGVIFGPLWTPPLVRRFGIRTFLLACLGIDAALFLAMKPLDALWTWFALRLALGIAGSGIFTAAEASINLLAGDASRGRIIGIYMAVLSGGFALGPLLLMATGIAGWPPFLVAAGVPALASLPLIAAGALPGGFGREPAGGALAVFVTAPFLVLAAGLYGFFEQTALSLLPIWGVRTGLAPTTAAALLTALGLGSVALQLPIGVLSDKMARLNVLRLCALAGLIGAALLPLAARAGGLALFAAVPLWGGFAAGIYPVTLAIAGARFRGAELVSANAAIIIAYGLGSLLGPSLGGVAMDLWNPDGLLAAFIVLFGVFVLLTVGWRRASLGSRP